MELYFKMSEKIILNVFLRDNKCHKLYAFMVLFCFKCYQTQLIMTKSRDRKIGSDA